MTRAALAFLFLTSWALAVAGEPRASQPKAKAVSEAPTAEAQARKPAAKTPPPKQATAQPGPAKAAAKKAGPPSPAAEPAPKKPPPKAPSPKGAPKAAPKKPQAKAPPKKPTPPPKPLPPGVYARIKTAKGDIVMAFFPDKAPMAVENFIELAKGERPWRDKDGRWVARPFYDGLTFHRIEDGKLKLIQGGCLKGDGTGGPGYEFDSEIAKGLKFDRPAMVAMANSGPDTNGSQFFITVAPAPWLSGRYTIFAKVVRGLDVVKAISGMPKEPTSSPDIHRARDPVVMERVIIEEVPAKPAAGAAKKSR